MTPLHTRTLTTARALEELRGEWVGLLERTENDLPFVLPEWAACWWEAFGQRGPLIGDSLRVMTARDEAGKLVGLAPMMSTERPRLGPVRIRSLAFLGVDQFVSELRTPIVDPSYEGEVARAFASELLADQGWDWISWDGLERGSTFARVLEETMGLRWGAAETGNLLALAPTWEDFRGGLKRNIKESLRHCYNSLKREGKTAHLVVAKTADEIQRALSAFFTLHTARAQQTGSVTHPDRFAPPPVRRFLEEVCARLAERGIARVLTLMVDDVPVASRVAFLLPNCLYLYYSGFDPAWGKYSVATTLVAEAIRYAIDLGLPRLHLSMGVDVSKSRWGPEMPVLYEAVTVRRRLSSRAALRLYSWARTSPLLDGSFGRLLPKRRFDRA
ncbi:MAG: GNAT family N-acetyltransferase [Polyangiaceae bacterium]|jgi:CelD/BcsL family acetyltransferase involved in cellulose biosynthesis